MLLSLYFNSIKVRLEPDVPCFRCYLKTAFQFHKGTIRTIIKIVIKVAIYAYFNSIKVRLELVIVALIVVLVSISIP